MNIIEQLQHAFNSFLVKTFHISPTDTQKVAFTLNVDEEKQQFGDGRGGIIGDVLANVLAFLGHHVTKEFYINDAGVQMKKLGASLKARCEQAVGLDSEIPEDGYQGSYLIDLANELLTEHGKK